MAATQIAPDRAQTSARRRSALDIVMLVGLFTVVAVDAVVQLIEGHLIPPVIVFMSIYLVCGIIVATGWRWAMVFPLVFSTLGVVGELSTGFPLYALSHPSADYVAFINFVLNYPLQIMVIGAAGTKLAQTLRREPVHRPRWLSLGLGVVAGVMLGALLIGLNVRATVAGGASGAGTETVHLAGATFAPNIVALHKGDTLTIVDDAPVPHILTNGSWSKDNRPVPGVEPGAVILNNVNLNNNTVTVGPFTTPGTYHIYCTVHPGMTLTISVV